MENKKKINEDFHQLYSIWKKHRDELALKNVSSYNDFAKRINYEVVPFIQILKNAKILDYGCGCGYVGLLCLLLEGTQVDFFDPLEKNLKYLRYLVNEYNFNNYKIFSTDLFPEINYYDVFILYGVLPFSGNAINILRYARDHSDKLLINLQTNSYISPQNIMLKTWEGNVPKNYLPFEIVYSESALETILINTGWHITQKKESYKKNRFVYLCA